METEAQRKARVKYQEKNLVQIALKLNRGTDADILEKLETVQSKMGYIKEAIRHYMKTGH